MKPSFLRALSYLLHLLVNQASVLLRLEFAASFQGGIKFTSCAVVRAESHSSLEVPVFQSARRGVRSIAAARLCPGEEALAVNAHFREGQYDPSALVS